MARAATTSDAFNAVAEPRRREILDLLSRRGGEARVREGGGVAVGEIVEELKLPQPTVSKHLSVLRQVGLVTVMKVGRERLYGLAPEKLKVVHDWVQQYERFWARHVADIKELAERKAREREVRSSDPPSGRS